MQMILSAGFPERLLERQSGKAFKIVVFFLRSSKKKSNSSKNCQSLQDLKEWLKHKKWGIGVK